MVDLGVLREVFEPSKHVRGEFDALVRQIAAGWVFVATA